MLHFIHPASDVVSDARPYHLVITADGALPATELAVSLRLFHADSDLITTSVPTLTGTSSGWVVDIDAAPLSPGEYRGEVVVTAGDIVYHEPLAFYRMTTPLDRPFPFAMYAVSPYPDNMPEWDALLDRLRVAGINLICQHMGGMEAHGPYLDHAARKGIHFMPSDNLHVAGLERREEWLDRLAIPETDEQARQLCVNHPEIRRQATAAFARHLREYRAHPAFSGLVYYGDDLFLRFRHVDQRLALSCYCEHCRWDFAVRTGLQAPETTAPRRGVVPADDPWLQWHRYRCGQVFGGFIEALEMAKNDIDADIQVGMVHGFPQQPFTFIGAGIYAPLTQPTAVVSSYCYPYLCAPRVDLLCHAALGRMGQREKPLWMLGAINSNYTLYPAWMVYQNYWNMLAAGYDFIAFFAWWDMGIALTKGDTADVDEEMQALARCGEHAAWILPTAKHWQVPRQPFALLYSFTTEACDLAPVYRGDKHIKAVLEWYRQAIRAQVPVEIICEEEILDGMLSRYQAVCLTDVRALPDTVYHRLDEFMAQGGTVFVDSDFCSYIYDHQQLHIWGATEMSAETMIDLLAERQPPAVRADNPLVTVSHLTAGATDYYVVVNNAADRCWGMPFHYDNPAANYRDMALVRDDAVEVALESTCAGYWWFDMATGSPLGSTEAPLTLMLEPSWGRVLVALPCEYAELVVSGDTTISQGQSAHLHVDLRDPAGQHLDAAFTIKVTLISPSGHRLRDGEFLGCAAGTG